MESRKLFFILMFTICTANGQLQELENLPKWTENNQQCVFNSGQCTYKLQLTSSCDRNIENKLIQSDRSRMNGIEKSLIDVQLEHSKIISSLENQVSRLSKKQDALPQYSKPETRQNVAAPIQIKDSNKAINTTKQKKREVSLLKQLQLEFNFLRKELYEARKQLKDSQKSLRISKRQNSKTQDLLKTTNDILNKTKLQLLDSKNEIIKVNVKLSQCETKNNELVEKSKQKQNTIESLKGELKQCNKQLYIKDSIITELNDRIDEQKLEIKKCHDEIADMKVTLQNERDNYVQLFSRFNNLTAELNATKIELIECTREKMLLVMDINKALTEISACRQDIDNFNNILENEEIRYEVLSAKFENVSEILNQTTIELIERGKVAMYCGFEDPTLCGYTQGEDDDMDWVHWSLSTPSTWTGPKGDHTCGNDRGHYMYVETTGIGKDNLARLLSPKFRAFEEQCIEFYYNMYGKDVGTLNVYLLVDGWELGNAFPPPVWRAFGNQGSVWSMARLNVPNNAAVNGYQVVFEVMTRAGYAGDIALDDIRIFDGNCVSETKSLEQWRVESRNSVIETIRTEKEKLRIKKNQ